VSQCGANGTQPTVPGPRALDRTRANDIPFRPHGNAFVGVKAFRFRMTLPYGPRYFGARHCAFRGKAAYGNV